MCALRPAGAPDVAVACADGGGCSLLPGTVAELRDVWEATSFQIERLQAAEANVAEEQAGLASRSAPRWALSFTPQATSPEKMAATDKVSPRARRRMPEMQILRHVYYCSACCELLSAQRILCTLMFWSVAVESGECRGEDVGGCRCAWPSSGRRAATGTARWGRPSSRPAWSRGT